MALKAGRVGVNPSEVDLYGRIKNVVDLEQISDAISDYEKLGYVSRNMYDSNNLLALGFSQSDNEYSATGSTVAQKILWTNDNNIQGVIGVSFDLKSATAYSGLVPIFVYTDDSTEVFYQNSDILTSYNHIVKNSNSEKTVKQIKLSYWNDANVLATIKNLQIEIGEVRGYTPYIPPNTEITKIIASSSDYGLNNVVSESDLVANATYNANNVYDTDASLAKTASTKKYPCNGGDIVTIAYNEGISFYRVVFFDSGDTVISSNSLTGDDSKRVKKFVSIAPANAKSYSFALGWYLDPSHSAPKNFSDIHAYTNNSIDVLEVDLSNKIECKIGSDSNTYAQYSIDENTRFFIGKLDDNTNYLQFYVNGKDYGYIKFDVSRNVGVNPRTSNLSENLNEDLGN